MASATAETLDFDRPFGKKRATNDEVEKHNSVPDEATLEQAHSGDEASQLWLGEHYLTLADSGVTPEENVKRAVDWLIKASKQGNEQATQALKERCCDNNIGITTENKAEVKWCINTTGVEKRVRSAARSLFRRINQTRHDIITKDEYLCAIKTLTEDKLEEALLTAAGKAMGDEISEDAFVKTVSKRVQGKIQPTSAELESSHDRYETATVYEKFFQNCTALSRDEGYKVLKYPRTTLLIMVDRGLEYASKEGLSWLSTLIPVHQIQLLLMVFLYNFMTASFFLFMLIPLFVFYVSLLAMMVTTLQMFYGRKKLGNVGVWANILKHQDVGIDVELTKSQFCWNSLVPYILYFVSLFFALVSFSLADKNYIPCSELTVLSIMFASFCFAALSDSYDLLLLLSVSCNFLSALPVFLKGFPYIPIVTWILHLIIGPIISLDIFSLFRINIGLASMSYIIIPLFFVRMAMRNSWQGTYRVLIPHLICYFWWNFVTCVFPHSTWIGLVRATVGYLLFPVLFPVLIVLGVIYGIYLFIGVLQGVGKILVTLLLVGISFIIIKSKKLLGKKFGAKYGKFKTAAMVILAFVAIVPLVTFKLPTIKDTDQMPLTASMYSRFCHREMQGTSLTTANSQIKCNQLSGFKVTWRGKIKDIKITDVDNKVEKFLSNLPNYFADQLRCIYGEPYPSCDDMQLKDEDQKFCQLVASGANRCHIKSENFYEFQIEVYLQIYGPVFWEQDVLILKAGHHMKEIFFALQPGDEIEFNAVLNSHLGTNAPVAMLKKISCTNRDLPIMQAVVEAVDEFSVRRKIDETLSVLFNFIWYPFLEYTPSE